MMPGTRSGRRIDLGAQSRMDGFWLEGAQQAAEKGVGNMVLLSGAPWGLCRASMPVEHLEGQMPCSSSCVGRCVSCAGPERALKLGQHVLAEQ